MIRLSGCLISILMMVIVSCADEKDLIPEYMVDKPKVLAVVVEDPETTPSSQISMRLLVGGRQVDQAQDQDVTWLTGFDPPQYCTAAYNDTCTITLPEATEISDYFGDNAWFDMPVFSHTVIQEKNYFGQKVFRVTYEPVGKNPEIEAIEVSYIEAGTVNQGITIVASGEEIRFEGEDCPEDIAFTAVPAVLDMPDANDELIFRWKVSLSKTGSGNRLYTNTDASDVQDILGEGEKAAEFRQSVVFSLLGESHNDGIQYGEYDIYLIIRDKASNAQDRSEDRLGMIFFYFTLIIEPST